MKCRFDRFFASEDLRKKILDDLQRPEHKPASIIGPVQTEWNELKYLSYHFTYNKEKWYMTARDVTKKEQARIAQRKEKYFSEMIVNNLPGIFGLADGNGRIVQVNRNFEQLTGYAANELHGEDLLSFFGTR